MSEAVVGRAEHLDQPTSSCRPATSRRSCCARAPTTGSRRGCSRARCCSTARATASFSSNLRFRWEYRPGSELFVVYTDERDTLQRGFPDLKNRAFVVKINRLLRLLTSTDPTDNSVGYFSYLYMSPRVSYSLEERFFGEL